MYKNILIGTNVFSPDWLITLNKINKKNIIIINFAHINKLKNALVNNNIKYVLPLSEIDYNQIKTIELSDDIEILYPNKEIHELLHNKISFTEFMLENFSNLIPDVYYLKNVPITDTEYPAIYKPIYSTNGKNMKIIFNINDLTQINNKNIIQKFIDNEYEYGANILCMNGIIINWKVIRFKYNKYHIKQTNFPKKYENVENFNIQIFSNIIGKLNYSGGMCIDFKFDEPTQNIYIFEINPRFGGSAFSCDFIYELLCIK